MFVLYYVWSYSMTSTLNVDSLTSKMDCWKKASDWNVSKVVSKVSTWLKAHKWLLPQKLWRLCQLEFFKTEETNVLGNRNLHTLMMYSNTINISVIIGSMIAASTKSMQFISVTVLKIIFKWHTEKTRFWTHDLDA